MDFVVVGLGLGTLAILAGVLTLVWVAGRWERAAARATMPEDAAHDKAVAAGRRGAGQALIGAGVAVLIATIGALAGSLDDQIGAFFVTTTATVAALGLLVWAYLYRTRNPLPPRRRIGTEDGGRETGDGRREDVLGGPKPALAQALPLASERTAGEESGEEEAPGESKPAIVEPEESVDGLLEAPEEPEPTMYGDNVAPVVLHGPEQDDEDDWEGRSERKS